MDEVFDAAWSARFGGRHPAIETELATLVDVHGSSLADQPAQLRLLLTQACPDARQQVATLVAAAAAGIATRLRGASDNGALPVLFSQCVGQLQRHGFDEVDWAWWAVRTWAHAFALPTSGKRVGPIAAPSGEARAAIAPWMLDSAAPAHMPPAMKQTRSPPADPPRLPDILLPPHDVSDREIVVPAIVEAPAPVAVAKPVPIDVPVARMPSASPPRDDRSESTPPIRIDPQPRRSRRASIAAAAIVVLAIVGSWAWSTSRAPTTTIASTTPPAPVEETPAATSSPPPAPSAVASSTAASTTPVAAVAPPAVATPEAAAIPGPAEAPASAKTPMPTPAVVGAATTGPAASPPRRPVIARIDVPRILDGEPFAVLVRLASDPKDVARIERRITPASGTWPRSGNVEFPEGTRVTDAMPVPFRGIAAPAQATVEFVAIGRDGSRSPPGSVRLAIVPSPRPPSALASAAPPPTAIMAAGCAPTTCGVVTASRQLETGAGVAIYQITVRNDARDTLSFTVPYRLQSGTRVHVNGGRLVPIGAAGP